jgi:hypothetical protein
VSCPRGARARRRSGAAPACSREQKRALIGARRGLDWKSVLPPTLRRSVLVVQVVAALTLLRSIALDRWITVFAAAMLLFGAYVASRRGPVWSLALLFALGGAFTTAFFVGIAPMWFCLVGVVAARPLLQAWRALTREDSGAAKLLAAGALGSGALGALAWKSFALDLFRAFPALTPSFYPNHGFVVAGLAAAFAAIAGVSYLRNRRADAAARIEEPRLRIDAVAASDAADDEALFYRSEQAEVDLEPRKKRLA